MKIIALDIGERRVGVAVGDDHIGVALPRTTLVVDDDVVGVVSAFLSDERPELVVVGLPISLNGSLGHQSQRILALAQEIANRASLPFETWDERLTSVEAERLLRDARRSPTPRRRSRRKAGEVQNVDSLAATIILQAYFDNHSLLENKKRSLISKQQAISEGGVH